MAGSSTAPDKSEYQARVGQNFRLVSASTATLRVPVARMYPDLSDVYLAAGSLSCARTQTSKLKTVYQATSDTVVQRQSFGTVVPDELSLLGLRSLRTVGPALGHYCHLPCQDERRRSPPGKFQLDRVCPPSYVDDLFLIYSIGVSDGASYQRRPACRLTGIFRHSRSIWAAPVGIAERHVAYCAPSASFRSLQQHMSRSQTWAALPASPNLKYDCIMFHTPAIMRFNYHRVSNTV